MDGKDRLKGKSLKFSFLDGIFASGMTGFTQDYFAPFLLLLGGTARHIGMLTAFPNLFASLIQLKSADITERLKSRSRIINLFVYLQAVMLLPMLIISLSKGAKPYIFITAVVLFTSFGAISMPAWSSLMSDLVRPDKRGEYFGWRNKVLGSLIVVATFMAGFILNQMKRIGVFTGFAIIFASAFVFRIISWYFLTRMYEPHLEQMKEDRFTFFNFLARTKESNFARFVIFTALMSFSVNLVSPFFAVLMLKDLHFSYLAYTIVTVAATLTVYLTISRWGRHADKVGNLKVLRFVSKLIGIIPLFWIINRNPVYLVIAQIFSGFLWAGYNLCASNFIYDAVSPGKRTRCISYFNVINGAALSCGALLGGFLVKRLPAIFGYKILSLCLLSAVFRLIIAFWIPSKLKEVRPVAKVHSAQLFFSMIGIRPIIGR